MSTNATVPSLPASARRKASFASAPGSTRRSRARSAMRPMPICSGLKRPSPISLKRRNSPKRVHAKFPGKLLAYNCSPSFNWKAKLDAATIAKFQRELGAMGYKFQFVTLAGFHALNYSMFKLAHGYRDRGMAAYSELQEAEFAAEADGYTADETSARSRHRLFRRRRPGHRGRRMLDRGSARLDRTRAVSLIMSQPSPSLTDSRLAALCAEETRERASRLRERASTRSRAGRAIDFSHATGAAAMRTQPSGCGFTRSCSTA